MTRSAKFQSVSRRAKAATMLAEQMPDPEVAVGSRFLRTPEAATYLGLSARTLEKHRTYGTGPVYRKLGSRIVYAIDELEAWAELGTRRSTSDPGNGTVYPAKSLPEIAGKARSTRCV
jgi:predicted DNA-binding transcriptional regulator AlpA